MSDKYNQRVRAIATEIAKEMHPTAYEDRSKSVQDSNYWHIKIDSYFPAARISVAHMAEAVILYAYDGDMKAHKRNEPNGGYVTNYLKEQGLIPDSAQEAKRTVPVEIEVPVCADMPQSVKESAITAAAEGAAMMLLSAFMMCGLQTHIETTIVNDPTKERFRLSFTKIPQPEDGQNG